MPSCSVKLPFSYHHDVAYNNIDKKNIYDEQTYKQTILIALGTVMGKLPKLLDDLTFWYVPRTDSNLIKNYYTFKNDLFDLSNKIDERNNNRSTPFFGCHPKNLQLSLSQ